ncbi:complex I NDUFA9 subunit family protein [Natrarchaeobius halalkaliphilus]|uniref:Complex I NDUFA9 subunit family protein n=1 Tax=Natrarchaeobius halalkaliphilus TaxID=1679091 RepID=A0A3N6P6Y2_9EURY|nr:complex I NDUFA9 subunit family protein [Natrarchaeobius halalkaliphilus]RQG91655.1 complex I NDUFA9 subunit family protein [Natrarchaeobius halalkaliphilus]
MKVLVAGGTGFIGTNLCAELVERGHDVTALSRTPDDDVRDGVELAVGDVTAYDSIVDTVADHDKVVNLVALSPLYQAPDNAQERVHLGGTENLVRAAEAGDVDRLVQISALGADPNSEIDHIRAKGRAERVVRESSLDWTIFRPSVVFGDGAEFLEFTTQVTTPYVTGLPGGGRTRFQPIWVGDLVTVLAGALESDDHIGAVYEVAGPQVVTLADATELAYEAEDKPVSILPVPMALAKIGLAAVGPVPFVPFGPDQARSLEIDNTVGENDVSAFGLDEDDLTTLRTYLGADSN